MPRHDHYHSFCADLLLCVMLFSAGALTPAARPAGQTPARPSPSLKAPEPATGPPPAAVRKRYDREKRLTYLYVDIPRIERSSNQPGAEQKAAGDPWEVGLSFQLIYRGGAAATELSAAYLLLNAAGTGKLEAIKSVSLEADGYQYEYERIDYSVGEVIGESSAPQGGKTTAAAAAPTPQETIVLRLQTGDVAQLANANRVYVRLGGREFVVRSFQLTGLRGALLSHTAN